MNLLFDKADYITFFYPVWWNDMPAIMKGFIDRVFAQGFAYQINNGKAEGLLQQKKIILVCTLGNNQEQVQISGLEQAMRLKEKVGVFGYCGIQEVEHYFLYDVYASEDIRNKYISQMQELAKNLSPFTLR